MDVFVGECYCKGPIIFCIKVDDVGLHTGCLSSGRLVDKETDVPQIIKFLETPLCGDERQF